MTRDDRRSPEAIRWRKLYKSTAWRKGRRIFLAQHPLCERCLAAGRTVAATVVNHRVAHKGDEARFFAWANWEAICPPCHDRDVKAEEMRGYSTSIGLDGWPRDSRHPANR